MTPFGRRRIEGPQSLLVCILPFVTACGSCGKESGDRDGGSSPSPSSSHAPVVAEVLPRCRASSERLALAGEDVVVGDVAIGASGLLVGLIRTEGGKRIASVIRTTLDLGTSSAVDLGPALGDEPPPSPRWNGNVPWVAALGLRAADAGPRRRVLKVAELGAKGLTNAYVPVLQQPDESSAFDIAWSDGGTALAAWDEDAPASADAGTKPVASERGCVKVQVLAKEGAEAPAHRIASPDASDAESPRLLARGSGFWLAWLARKIEDDPHLDEGPGERRAFRWVEVVPLDARGEAAGPVRRVSSEKGRAATFELARSGPDLVVVVQDEAAPSEGAGSRIVRYRITQERSEKLDDIVDGGVGQTLVELVPMPASAAPPAASSNTNATSSELSAARWLAWSDIAEHAQMTPLGPGLAVSGRTSPEPALDGARVLAQNPPDAVYALVGAEGPGKLNAGAGRGRSELRRFACR